MKKVASSLKVINRKSAKPSADKVFSPKPAAKLPSSTKEPRITVTSNAKGTQSTDDPFAFLSSLSGTSSVTTSKKDDESVLLRGKASREQGEYTLNRTDSDIASMVLDALSDTTPAPRDMRIDDSGIPQAKNVYDWCFNERFAKDVLTPFLEQLIWGVILFAEFCPVCSDTDWLFHDHKVDDTFQTFEKKVCMLEHGVCPSCKGTRTDFVRKGKLNFYQELAVQAGQRCVTGDTLILTDQGLMRIDETMSDISVQGFSEKEVTVLNGQGTFEKSSHVFIGKEEPVYVLTLANGQVLRGTGDHPVFTSTGDFKCLKNISDSDILVFQIGHNIFGSDSSHGDSDAYYRLGINFEFCRYSGLRIGLPKSVRSAKKELQLAFLRGLIESRSTATLRSLFIRSGSITSDISGILNNLGIFHHSIYNDSITVSGRMLDKLNVLLWGDSVNVYYTDDSTVDWYDDFSILTDSLNTLVEAINERHPEFITDTFSVLLYNVAIKSTRANARAFIEHCLDSGLPAFWIRDTLHTLRRFTDDGCYPMPVMSCIKGSSELTYDFTLPKTHAFWTNGIISHNSGKTTTTGGIFAPYMTHRILKMQKPTEVYGISNSTILHGTFVALTYVQARETLWEYYYATLCESAFFMEYHAMLRHYEEKYGQQLLKFNDTFVVYRPRNFMCYPSGPDQRTLRGKTRIFTAADEIGWMDNDAQKNKIRVSARGLHEALDRSLLTIRGAANNMLMSGYYDTLNGIAMNVSSPSSQRDKICELVREAKSSKVIYGIHRPTWEINPTLPRNNPVIVEAYRTDPLKADRDYGANPPISSSPFISSREQVERALKGEHNQATIICKTTTSRKTNESFKFAEFVNLEPCSYPSLLALDASYSNNSFGLVCGHRHPERGYLIADVVIEIMPEPGTPLNYTNIFENIITPLIEERNVKVVLADRWNSLKILHDIKADEETIAEQYSLKYRDLGFVKSHLEANTLLLPSVENKMSIAKIFDKSVRDYPKCFETTPIQHLVLQILTVQDIGNGVTKGPELTDDVFRALALFVYGFESEKYSNHLIYEDEPEEAPSSSSTAAYLLGGSGTTKRMGSGSSGTPDKSLALLVRRTN